MKKRGTKVLAGLMTAGMLAATGVVGVQSMGVTTTETVNYEMEKNEYGLAGNKETVKKTKYNSFYAMIMDLPKGTGYTEFWMKGYDQKVVGIADRGSIKSDNTATHVQLYIMKNGELWRIGEINNLSSGLSIRNGVLCGYAVSDKNGIEEVYIETYLISPDRKGMFIRDFLRMTNYYTYAHYDGYINNNGVNTGRSFSTNNENMVPEPETGWAIDRYEPIKFRIR